MRLSFCLAAAILATPAMAEPKMSEMRVFDPTAQELQSCPPIGSYYAARKGGKARAQRLGELPAADAYKAVFLKIDGCVVPVIAGYGFGLPHKVRR